LREISNIIKTDNDQQHTLSFGYLINQKIIQIRFNLLRKQIKNLNVEINQDKKTVSEKINLLGFNENYNELLNCIDNFLQTETSKVVNAGMISTLRTFMADLIKDIANRIAIIEKEKIPEIDGKGDMGNIRSYIKNKLELSEKDNKFIDSFIDILHAEGGHSFMSEKEYFRLSRNIAIEIALFMLSKYEKKYKTS
jgi:transcriptional regulator of heat shock response